MSGQELLAHNLALYYWNCANRRDAKVKNMKCGEGRNQTENKRVFLA